MYQLRNLPRSALRHADAVCRISMCLQLYQFWLVRQRCRCQPHNCCSGGDCACLIIYQSLCCEMNAGRTRGGSALRSLCGEWLSWASVKEDGARSSFFLFFILSLPFHSVCPGYLHSLFLSGAPSLPFFICSLSHFISLHSFSCASPFHSYHFSLCPSHPLPLFPSFPSSLQATDSLPCRA